MTQEEMIKLAKEAIDRSWTYEQLKYSDDMYGEDSFIDDIWDLVIECEAIGTIAFDEKYQI